MAEQEMEKAQQQPAGLKSQDGPSGRGVKGEDDNASYLFGQAPIPVAVAKNAIPSMIAMIMVLIYNLADTFFIGQTGNALLVAAVSLATPLFLTYMAIGSLFGVGGSSVISRALGAGDTDRARKTASFCVWCCLGVGVAFALFVLVFMDPLVNLLGASSATYEPTVTYLFITAFAGPLVCLCECFANVVRAEGTPNRAMMGMVAGNVVNVVLDPILILLLGWGIAGAAAATLIGNVVALCIYLEFYFHRKSTLGCSPKRFAVKDGVAKNVLVIGFPAALASLIMNVSQIAANSLMSGYGDLAVSGLGVAMKIVMITGMIAMGLSQGVLPLLGYCVGAKMWERFKKAFTFSLVCSVVLSAAMMVLCYVFAGQIAAAFVTDDTAWGYAVRFARILLTTSFLFGVFYLLGNTLQAMGAAGPALVVNISRQGLLYIPLLFVLEHFMGADGIAWAQPAADVASIALAVGLFIWAYKKMRREAA